MNHFTIPSTIGRAVTGIADGAVVEALARRQAEGNYQKFLAFNELIRLEKGMRAENNDYKTALSVTYRKRDNAVGLSRRALSNDS